MSASAMTATKATLSFMRALSKQKIVATNRNAILSLLNGFDDFHINEPGRNLPMDMYLRFHFLKQKKDFNTAARTQIVDYVYTM